MNFHFENKKIFIIAELSGNHLQNLSNAKELIKKSYEAGADAVKIQTYTPDTISINQKGVSDKTKKKYHEVKIDHPDWKNMSYNDLYEKVYTPWEWHSELDKEAKKYGLPLFSTPFDFTSVDFLENQKIPFYKIASYDVVNLPLIKKVAKTGKPVIMSVGMASEEEIWDAVNTLKENGCSEYALLHCISSYPASVEELNLSKIKDLEKKFNCTIGFSDHSLDLNSPAMAVLAGAQIIERHICLERKLGGPDSSFSSEPHEFREFITKIREIENSKKNFEELKGNFSDYKIAHGKPIYGPANEFEKSGVKARPSIWVNQKIQEGDEITERNIKIARPGKGLRPKYYEEILGKISKKNLEKGEPFSLDFI